MRSVASALSRRPASTTFLLEWRGQLLTSLRRRDAAQKACHLKTATRRLLTSVLTMSEEAATPMDIDKKPAAGKSGKSDKLQLPWVEKYRPNRCACHCCHLEFTFACDDSQKERIHMSLFSPWFVSDLVFFLVVVNSPNRLEDLVAHEDIISIITKLIDSDNLPHLLLYGPPGTGKVCLCNDLMFSLLWF